MGSETVLCNFFFLLVISNFLCVIRVESCKDHPRVIKGALDTRKKRQKQFAQIVGRGAKGVAADATTIKLSG